MEGDTLSQDIGTEVVPIPAGRPRKDDLNRKRDVEFTMPSWAIIALRAVAARRGMTFSEYVRLLCLLDLDVLETDPELSKKYSSGENQKEPETG